MLPNPSVRAALGSAAAKDGLRAVARAVSMVGVGAGPGSIEVALEKRPEPRDPPRALLSISFMRMY